MDPQNAKELGKMMRRRARASGSSSKGKGGSSSTPMLDLPVSGDIQTSLALAAPVSSAAVEAIEEATSIPAGMACNMPVVESPSLMEMEVVLAHVRPVADEPDASSLRIGHDSHPLPEEVAIPGPQLPNPPVATIPVESHPAPGEDSSLCSRKRPRDEAVSASGAHVSYTPAAPMLEMKDLQDVAARLKEDFLSPEERVFIEGRGMREQVKDALHAMTKIGHHLANFASYASLNYSLELRCAQERISQLEYNAEQRETAIESLGREIDAANAAVQESDERIARRDKELVKMKNRTKGLESRNAKAQNDCRRAEEELGRLKRTLQEPHNGSRWERDGSHEGSSRRDGQHSRSRSQRPSSSMSERDVDRLVEGGKKVVEHACLSAYSAGFEQCKRLLQSSTSITIPREILASSQDEVLKSVVAEFIDQLLKTWRPNADPERRR